MFATRPWANCFIPVVKWGSVHPDTFSGLVLDSALGSGEIPGNKPRQVPAYAVGEGAENEPISKEF